MAISGIVATNVNGIQDVSTTQNIAAGVNATITDEVVLIRAGIQTNNTTGTLVITNSAMKAGDLDPISYGSGTQSTSTIEINDSYIEWNLATTRRNIKVSKLIGTHIRSTSSGGFAFLYTQAGNKAVLDSKDSKPTVIDGIFCHEISGAPAIYRNTIYKNCGLNILNWEAGDLAIRNVNYGSGTRIGNAYVGADGKNYNTYDAWLGYYNSSNKFRFYDCIINISKIMLQGNNASEVLFKYFSRTEKYLSGTNALNGINIRYKPTANTGSSSQLLFFVTTNSSGLTSTQKIDLLVENSINSGTTRASGISEAPTIYNYTLKTITWERRVRGYAYQSLSGDATPTSQVGDIGKEAEVYLLPVSFLTLTEAQALSLTGIVFAPSGATGGTVSLSETRTIAQLWQRYRAWICQQSNFDSDDTWTYDGTNLNIGDWTISGAEFLTGGTITLITATANGTISNLSIIGKVNQSIPTNLTNVNISGTLTYNTNTDTSVTLTNTIIGTVENIETGIVTINKSNSTITNYVDAEINFIDSSISIIGADSVTIHPTANDRNLNQNISATFTSNYVFKYGSIINGTTMSNTLYLRCVAGSIPFYLDATITVGDNVEDLGMTALLSSLGAKMDTKPSLTQIEASSILSKKAHIETVNRNTIKASKLIPASEGV